MKDMTTTVLWSSSDNGQIVCTEHRPLYGRIPWHRIGPEELEAMRELFAVDGFAVECEYCRYLAREDSANARPGNCR